MAIVNVGDIYNLALGYTAFGQQCINTFAFKVITVPGVPVFDPAAMTDLGGDGIDSFWDVITTAMQPLMATSVKFNTNFVTKVDPVGTLPMTFAVDRDGTHVSPLSRINTALSIERSGDGPKHRRVGRIQVGGIPDNQATSGIWDSSIVNAGDVVGSLMVGSFTGPVTNIEFYVGFWREAFTKPDGTVLPARFQHCTVYNTKRTARTQRTRTVGVGI